MLRDGSFWDFGFALPGSVAAPNSQLLRQRHFSVGKDVAASLQPTVAAAAVFDGRSSTATTQERCGVPRSQLRQWQSFVFVVSASILVSMSTSTKGPRGESDKIALSCTRWRAHRLYTETSRFLCFKVEGHFSCQRVFRRQPLRASRLRWTSPFHLTGNFNILSLNHIRSSLLVTL